MGHPTERVRPGQNWGGRRFYSIVGLLALAVLILCVGVIGIARTRFAEERLRIAFRDTLVAKAPSSTVSLARSRQSNGASTDPQGPSLPYTEVPSEEDSAAVARSTREVWTISEPEVVSRGSQQVFVDGTSVMGRVIKAHAQREGSDSTSEFWIEISTYLPTGGTSRSHPLYELTGFWEIVPKRGVTDTGVHAAIRGRLSGKYASDPLLMEHLTAETTLLVPAVEGGLSSGRGEYEGSGRFAGRLTIPRPLASPDE